MSILTFLGTVDFSDADRFGTIHLRLALDLLDSVKNRETAEDITAKARNVIQVCVEPMFDNLIIFHKWDPCETDYADLILVQCTEVWVTKLLNLANHRIIPKRKYVPRTERKRKHGRRTKLNIEDLQLAAIMALVMDVSHLVGVQLEATFIQEHGAMKFSQ